MKKHSHINIFDHYQRKWDEASDQLDPEIQVRMFHYVQRRILDDAEQKALKNAFGKRKTSGWSLFGKSAAAACLLVLVSLGTYLYTRRQILKTGGEMTVRVERGQKASVNLPDGSRVWLNSDSKLSYGTAFNQKDRTIHLQGEAYFEVAKNKNKPFVVQLKQIEVEALGTKFSITSYPDDSLTITTLFEGKVRVGNQNDHTILMPDQAVCYNTLQNRLNKKFKVDSSQTALWRKNQLAFQGESLGEIAGRLERMYNVHIHFISPETKNIRFHGTIRNGNLTNVMDILSSTAPIRFSMKGQTLNIYKVKQHQKLP